MFIDIIKEMVLHVFIFLAIILIPTATIINLFNQRSCNKYQEVTGKQTKFIWFDNCYVETPQNGWLTKGEYGKVIIAREGLSH